MTQTGRKQYFFTWVTLLMVLTLCICASAMAGNKVLLVHSYHKGYQWVDSITAGVQKGLEGSEAQLEIFYMDTKRKTGEEWKKEAGKMAKEKVDAFKPDVVITSDDNAQEYFARDYAGKDGPQFVFCGVNAEASKYGFPAANVTGILERPCFIESLNLLKAIDRNIKTVSVISDDSLTSSATYDFIKQLEPESPVKIASFDQPSTFEQWQALVKKYQSSVDAIVIILYHTVKETVGSDSMDPKTVIDWTLANNKKPTASVIDFAVEDGVLCGIVESGEEHGMEAARIAGRILKGEKASDFPIMTARKGTVMFNTGAAGKLGIEIKVVGK